MTLRLATWNINSVRLRIDQVARFVQERAPDVLLLQEIKCTTDQFPRAAFEEMGLPHLRVAGQKGWHGVAIASRLPIAENTTLEVCKLGHARCVSARVAGVDIQNFYIPAGGAVHRPRDLAFRLAAHRAAPQGPPRRPFTKDPAQPTHTPATPPIAR